MINLNEANVGDTLIFSSGGRVIVEAINNNDTHISIRIDAVTYYYNVDGTHKSHRLMNIIDIEHKLFDWVDVKHGMAFTDSIGNILYYVGKSVCYPNTLFVFSEGGGKGNYHSFFQEQLTRSPENDKET